MALSRSRSWAQVAVGAAGPPLIKSTPPSTLPPQGSGNGSFNNPKASKRAQDCSLTQSVVHKYVVRHGLLTPPDSPPQGHGHNQGTEPEGTQQEDRPDSPPQGNCDNHDTEPEHPKCRYTNDEDITSLSADRLFSLDGDPHHFPISVQVYISALGWEGDTNLTERKFQLEQFITRHRMVRGLALLKKARAAGQGYFYDNFDGIEVNVKRHPRYPFLRTRTEIITEDYERELQCDKSGPMFRRPLFLTNVHLALPPGLNLEGDSDPLFAWSVCQLYSQYYPSCFLLALPMEDNDNPNYEVDDDDLLALSDDYIRERILNGLDWYLKWDCIS